MYAIQETSSSGLRRSRVALTLALFRERDGITVSFFSSSYYRDDKGDSTKERQCDNASCVQQVHLGDYKRGVVCSGCSEAQYCEPRCQEASWLSHEATCTVPLSVDLKAIRVRVKEDEEEYLDDSAITGVDIDIQYTYPETNATVKVGHAFLQVIDIAEALAFPFGFFGCLDEFSGPDGELARLALHFDDFARLRPNNGCWQPADFDYGEPLVFLTKLVVDVPWRGKGIGSDIFSKLFELRELSEAGIIVTYPNVLHYLEPKMDKPTRAAYQAKEDGIIKFYQKSAFRRLASSEFFCLAKDPTHPSHSIPIDQDAPYQDLPPPKTDEEALQRYMAMMP
ncbi:hypothetical protein FB45DRAFT_998113 [Roridomyces roridus]|uniref:MYND-type domain-containing protein n=1 Tax=Roridomyces roridus TaxID=1738132 RepID=A0AAD7CDY2_9AGAR|nr:hypothetical protein FB45DRAFT_998113 [Roridomyces roridus]